MSHVPRVVPSSPTSAARGRLPSGVLVLAVVSALAGCGDGDDATSTAARTTAATGTTDTHTATGRVNGAVLPPATSTSTDPDGTTVVTQMSSDTVIAKGVDRERGIEIALEPGDGSTPDEARGVVTVTRRAPLPVRRTLARRAAYILECDLAGAPGSQGYEIRPKGSRTATAVGTVYRTDGFVVPPKGRTVRDTVRSCSLHLAREPRGSTTRTTASGNPSAAYATVRFR